MKAEQSFPERPKLHPIQDVELPRSTEAGGKRTRIETAMKSDNERIPGQKYARWHALVNQLLANAAMTSCFL